MAGEALEYRRATPDEEALLEEIQERYHPDLNFSIGLYFRNTAQTVDGRRASATANKATKLFTHVTGCDGWIEVWEEAWFREDEGWREYLLDHELSHFTTNSRGELKMVGHNIEDNEEVLWRHPRELMELRRRLETAVQ